MKKIILILVVSLFLFSCVSMAPGMRGEMMTTGISSEVDDFTGNAKTKLNLPMGSLQLMAEISLGFKYTKGGDTEDLVMYTYLYKSDWLFVETVSFNIDGEIYDFDSIHDNREVITGSYIQETNYYSVDRAFLEKLASGNDIKIRISGKDYYIDPEFKPEYTTLIQEFIQEI